MSHETMLQKVEQKNPAAICSLSPWKSWLTLGREAGEIWSHLFVHPDLIRWLQATWLVAHGLCQSADTLSFIRLSRTSLQSAS